VELELTRLCETAARARARNAGGPRKLGRHDGVDTHVKPLGTDMRRADRAFVAYLAALATVVAVLAAALGTGSVTALTGSYYK
jgi:hypothetical protein